MPANPPEKTPAPGDEDPRWLLQFYSASKSADQSDPAHPLPGFANVPSEKYEIGDELGSGGMKSVLRTRDRNTERNVAMAVLRDPSVRWKKNARFVREARITAALEHPNIVPIYDIGLDEAGKPYFTMKLLGGETLQSILQRVHVGYGDYRGHYPLNSLLQIFQGVCNAIAFAHSRGVIHLDLKPANIQVGDFGEALVLDWGLAKILEKDPILCPNRLVLDKSLREIFPDGPVSGTPGFMSPEQTRGENAALNESTDIFALGAILYAILNCRKYPDKKADPRIRQEKAKVPAALEAVAIKAMSGEPSLRYQTVEELDREVRAYVEGYATEAQQAGALTQFRLLVKRHSVVATLATLSLVTVFAILSISLIKIHGSEQVALKAEQDAIAALTKFKAEQASKQQIGLLAAPHVMQQAQDAMHTLNYEQAISLLEQVVSLDKNFTDAWSDLAAIHLGRQEFEQAGAAFSHVPQPDATPRSSAPVDLQGVLEKYSALSRQQGNGALRKAQDDFVYDLINAGHNSWPIRQLSLAAFFKCNNRDPKTVDFDVIEKALQWLNADAKDMAFAHESTPLGLKISIHGDKVTEISPLAGLPISVLDASGTGNIGIEWLRDAPLISIDFSGSRAWDVRQLEQSATLQEMRLVGWRNKDYSRMQNFRALKRVIVDFADVAAAQKALEKIPDPPQVIGE